MAGDLFLERGYAAVSIRDIAAATGLTNGAVYGHFRSKGQLLVEVIRRKMAERDQATDFSLAATDPETGIELMYDERDRQIRMLEVDAAAAARHDPDVAAGPREPVCPNDTSGSVDAGRLARRPRGRRLAHRALTGGHRHEGVAGRTFRCPIAAPRCRRHDRRPSTDT